MRGHGFTAGAVFAAARGFVASLIQSFLLGVGLPLTPNPLSQGRGEFLVWA